MTAQEIFNKVYRHLLQQDQQAICGGSCRYRTADGLKCAVGVLIPDDLYTPDIEGSGVSSAVSYPASHRGAALADLLHRLGLLEHAALLMALQHVHDQYAPADWADRLQYVAKNHNLTVPEVPQ